MKYRNDVWNHFPTKNSLLTNPFAQVIKDKTNEDEDQDDEIYKSKYVFVICISFVPNIMYKNLEILKYKKTQGFPLFKFVQISLEVRRT